MSTQTQQVVDLCERLPEGRREQVADFARFLLSRESAAEDEDGDAAWERIIAEPRPRPKLEAFLAESAKEPTEPMDLDRMAPSSPLP